MKAVDVAIAPVTYVRRPHERAYSAPPTVAVDIGATAADNASEGRTVNRYPDRD